MKQPTHQSDCTRIIKLLLDQKQTENMCLVLDVHLSNLVWQKVSLTTLKGLEQEAH